MGGNKKQSASTKRNQGEDFYARIGSLGGKARTDKTKLRGTASLSPERRREIARLGGLARGKK